MFERPCKLNNIFLQSLKNCEKMRNGQNEDCTPKIDNIIIFYLGIY